MSNDDHRHPHRRTTRQRQLDLHRHHMRPSTRVCPHITRDGKSCPNLLPCEQHTRPANAPWTPDRNRGQQDRFRRQVLTRDNFTCVRCQHHDPTGRTLEAHHLRPGHHPTAGVTLCTPRPGHAGCHKALDPHAR